jgi:hypothetical protein
MLDVLTPLAGASGPLLAAMRALMLLSSMLLVAEQWLPRASRTPAESPVHQSWRRLYLRTGNALAIGAFALARWAW